MYKYLKADYKPIFSVYLFKFDFVQSLRRVVKIAMWLFSPKFKINSDKLFGSDLPVEDWA